MHVDKAAFLLALTTLAVGGAAGYTTAKSGVLEQAPSPGAAERQPAPPVSPAVSSAAPVEHRAPACDDMIGAPAACPPPGYSADEGGCDAMPTKRCDDFKRTMKPRVAERAVACLNALAPAQRCDPKRLEACAHAALMSACSVSEGSAGTATADDDVAPRCESIVQACAGTMLTPTIRDCNATLAGMTSVGRDQMASCMSAHCADKGLLGCEVSLQLP